MADATRPSDVTRVNVNQDNERRYWCAKWDVQPDKLREAVKAVGVMAKDVQRHLGK